MCEKEEEEEEAEDDLMMVTAARSFHYALVAHFSHLRSVSDAGAQHLEVGLHSVHARVADGGEDCKCSRCR